AASCSGDRVQPARDAGSPRDAGVDHVRVPYDGIAPPSAAMHTAVHAELAGTSVRTDTMGLMFAAGEMQTSGEPFVNGFAGRNLAYFDRYYLPPDLYIVPIRNGPPFFDTFKDLFGFSSAVESYEYSKYHMNIIANQSGAGVSLANGPLVAKLAGATPTDKLRVRMGQIIAASGANVGGFATLPPPANNPRNDFGFPGVWPNLYPFRSFDPAMTPDTTVVHSCTTVTGYGGVQQYGNNPVNAYECDYNSLRLNDRVAQTEHVLAPGVLGYTSWKEALWAIDFIGRLHDSIANPVTAVAPGDVARVGTLGNTVRALQPPGGPAGVYIGSTPLEGMWGLTMVEEMDNAAAWLLSSLATADGANLGGWPSVLSAIQYDYGSPLMWFPAAVAVTEDASTGRYPTVSSVSIADAASHAVDLAALAQGYSLFFGMTDARNAAVGQQPGMQIAFGGFPFAADDGAPDGEDSPHDRALAVMRVAFVDLDRMHVDPGSGVVVDRAQVVAGKVVRGAAVSTTSLGHVVVGLRHLLMACNAAVTQYGAPDADATKDALGVLNSVAIHPSGGAAEGGVPPTFSARVRAVLLSQADFVRDTLTRSDGTVFVGAALASPPASSSGAWSAASDPATLEAQGAAIRVLVEAFFLTQDASYRDRATAVARKLFASFWSDAAQLFRGQAGGADEVVMTPERFAWLQQALREAYEALWVQGDPSLDRAVLEDRIARVNKLYLNGWDDLNADQTVQPSECLGARLQLGEQALTGELGKNSNGFAGSSGGDRDADCVSNIARAQTASVLASQVRFHAP
ncbi:MAG: hypothetical protein M3O36_13205, partial [Myxococcota bacterium]|nr:hypothetical protein [Myxococcota bacterium]